MKRETTSAGGVVTRIVHGVLEVLVVERHSDVEPQWQPVLRQLPKGGVEEGESLELTATREVKEETGCHAAIEGLAGIAAWSYRRNGIDWHEVVHYFVMRPLKEDAAHDSEFDRVRWLPIEQALELLSYPEERALLAEVMSCGALGLQGIPTRACSRGKAAWLTRLRNLARLAVVDDFLVFSCADWVNNRHDIVSRITRHFGPRQPVIVRSSVSGEDAADESLAGVFRSEVVDEGALPSGLESAIDRVIASYRSPLIADHSGDEVLVQHYVKGVAISGVVLTYDVWQDRPYYIINYDDQSGRTHTVTAGGASKALRVPRGTPLGDHLPGHWKRVLDVAQEIESLFPLPVLSIEFAVTPDELVHVFQVRELRHRYTTLGMSISAATKKLAPTLHEVQAELRHLFLKSDALPGSRTVLADMPDWNPAEILGAAPRPLNTSLYRHLITARVWNVARASMGYTDVGNCELMLVLGCKPYIDARVSLNSLTPAELDPDARDAIVRAGIERLCAEPDLQDKLEFEVAFSSLDFGTESRLRALPPSRGAADISQRTLDVLTTFTNVLVKDGMARISADIQLIDGLQPLLAQAPLCRRAGDLSLCYQHVLRSCIENGTMPFTRLARLAFVALAFLRSARAVQLISNEAMGAFMASLRTVATGMIDACQSLADDPIAYHQFIGRFGHLRPRMYDITSMPYSSYGREFWEHVCKNSVGDGRHSVVEVDLGESLDRELKRLGLWFDRHQFTHFARTAIEAREYAKFCFSRCVSALLETTAFIGESMRIPREDLAFLTVEDVLGIPAFADSNAIRTHLLRAITTRHAEYDASSLVTMPSVLCDESDLYCIALHGSVPTFITRQSVHAPVVWVSDVRALNLAQIPGSILLIEAADPGFDWVLSLRPAGIITQFGDAGAHMAVRCGELNIAAALGCGEAAFQRLKAARIALLDCGAGKVSAEGSIWEVSR